MNVSRLAFLVLLLCFCTKVRADLILTIGNVADIANGDSLVTTDDVATGPFVAGSTVTIPFLAHFEPTGIIFNPITAYSLTVDVGGDGDGFPGAPDFFSSFNFASNIGGNLIQIPTAGSGAGANDFVVNWQGNQAISIDPTMPTTLFTLTFDTSVATPAGFYDILIAQDPDSLGQTAFSSNLTPASPFRFDQGRIEITAIPEPSSFAAMALVGVVAAFYRRRVRGLAF